MQYGIQIQLWVHVLMTAALLSTIGIVLHRLPSDTTIYVQLNILTDIHILPY